MSDKIAILGDGCASLSFAAKAATLEDYEITVIKPSGAPKSKDHAWGFWSDDCLREAENIARYSWNKWAIVTEQDCAVMSSETKKYHSFKRFDWIENRRGLAINNAVEFRNQSEVNLEDFSQVFDSRPPEVPDGAVLQHFYGIEVEASKDVFDPSTVLLMDFRVDQQNGMHFVYVLPYSKRKALIESTLFSEKVCDESYYTNSISEYLKAYFKLEDYKITHKEKGVIPLGNLFPHDPDIAGMGANAGATRPASGYAFLFIQRQIMDALNRVEKGSKLEFRDPHTRIDRWMDSMLLAVLKHYPEYGPSLFFRMGKSLSGDQFVKFMSGDAGFWIKAKVILSMPKMPFIKVLTNPKLRKVKKSRTAIA